MQFTTDLTVFYVAAVTGLVLFLLVYLATYVPHVRKSQAILAGVLGALVGLLAAFLAVCFN